MKLYFRPLTVLLTFFVILLFPNFSNGVTGSECLLGGSNCALFGYVTWTANCSWCGTYPEDTDQRLVQGFPMGCSVWNLTDENEVILDQTTYGAVVEFCYSISFYGGVNVINDCQQRFVGCCENDTCD